jgi:hypothetical protein
LNALGGHFVVQRTEVAHSGKDGIVLKARGPSTIDGAKIHGNGGAGVSVKDTVSCTIRDAELSNDAGPAEIVGAGEAEISVSSSKLTEGRGGGVFFQETSHGSLDDVTISGCALAALDIGTSVFVSAEGLTLDRNKSSGVLVRQNGKLLLVRSNLDASQEGHVWVMNGGRAALAECRVAAGKTGLWVQGGGFAYAYRTAFEGQAGTSVDAQPGARLVLSKCKVTGAMGDAVVAGPSADVRLVFAEVGGAAGAGLRAADGAVVRIEDSILEGSRGGDLVGRADVVASRISGQAGGAPGTGTPEERRKAADQAFDEALETIASSDG